MVQREGPPGPKPRRRLKTWQGWLLLAFLAILVPVLVAVYID